VNKQYQSHIIAFLGTLLSLCLILLLLWFLKLTAPVYEEEDGIVVTFGNAEEGGGVPDATHIDEITQLEHIPAVSLPTLPSDNDFIVQDDDESLALQKQSIEDTKRKAEDEALKRKKQQEEARVEAERIAHEKILAEQKAKEQEAIENAKELGALFGQTAMDEGANGDELSNKADANQGNYAGEPEGQGFGSVENATWTLQGRNCKHIPTPSEDFNQTGRVVVNIIVDPAGNVTSASVGDGSNISDRETQRLALESARSAKFSKGETAQRGTIVYIFTDKKSN